MPINLSTLEADAGGLLQVQSHYTLHSESQATLGYRFSLSLTFCPPHPVKENKILDCVLALLMYTAHFLNKNKKRF